MIVKVLNVCKYMLMFFVAVVAFVACSDKKHSLMIENGHIVVDGQRYLVASGEVDYARIPREYWDDRLELLSSIGFNTITVKVPWMLHEPEEGVFDFEGMKDVRAFCEHARDKGLFVWLHIGPYVGAEWDMGGLPWWLLNVKGINIRSTQQAFMMRVERYFAALGQELSSLMIGNGGNIALLQIEEEQGLTKDDKEYLKVVLDCAKRTGFDNIVTFTATTKENYVLNTIPEAYFSLDINTKVSAENNFTGVTKFRYDAPSVCSSVNGDYKAVWGGKTAARDWNKTFMRMYELLRNDIPFSINGVVAGNSYGSTAGASMKDGVYSPYTTSHNVDGIIKLWGGVDGLYGRFCDVLYTFAPGNDGKEKIKLDTVPYLASFEEVEVTDVAPLFESLPEPVVSKKIMTMEQCNVASGAVLYSTLLPAVADGAKLKLTGVHDYAQVFVDGALVATVDRRNGEDGEVCLQALSQGTKLDILVDATGRVGDVIGYKDYKGIVGGVQILSGSEPATELSDWKIYPLPADYTFASSKNYRSVPNAQIPGFYRVTFEKELDGDFYLYMGDWGKGEAWLNGKPLGRFWSCGPQTALYVPGCWVKDGANELVVVDWVGPSRPVALGTDFAKM